VLELRFHMVTILRHMCYYSIEKMKFIQYMRNIYVTILYDQHIKTIKQIIENKIKLHTEFRAILIMIAL
jgi:hypothetical protein